MDYVLRTTNYPSRFTFYVLRFTFYVPWLLALLLFTLSLISPFRYLQAAYSKTPASIRRLPPRLGEHSVEILREAGLDAAEIDALLASGAARTGR